MSTNKKIVIRPGDDFSDIYQPIELTRIQFAYHIWLFDVNNEGIVTLHGLYRNGIIEHLKSIGYYKRYRENKTYVLINEKNNIIEEVKMDSLKDAVFINIEEPLEFVYKNSIERFTLEHLKECFLNQSHLIFNKNFLEHLPNHTKPILKDNSNTAFFCFENIIIEISKSGIEFKNYDTLEDQCIWRNHIKASNFNYLENNRDCHFSKFIDNVTNNEPDRYQAFITAIGYLLHNYSHPSKGQAVIAYDEEITDLKNPMGGTGKGLFANSLKQMREVIKIDGKKFDPNDKFKFQDINDSSQIIWLDDVKPELGFETFHSCLTDGWSIEKKFKDQFFIKPEDSPKMLICSNAVLNGEGSTNKRRQFIIEFSNYYSKQIKLGNEEPIRSEHGCIFFDKDDWSLTEWDKFYSFMLDCVYTYLNDGLQYYSYKSIGQNKLRQSTSEDFCEWIDVQQFNTDIEYDTKQMFLDFKLAYYGEESKFDQRSFTNWMKRYAKSKDWNCLIKRSNSISKIIFQAVRL